jgi:hypothetical protein
LVPGRLLPVLAQGFSAGAATELRAAIVDLADNQRIDRSFWEYSFEFVEGFTWGAIGEAYGKPFWNRLGFDTEWSALAEAVTAAVSAGGFELVDEFAQYFTGTKTLNKADVRASTKDVVNAVVEATVTVAYASALPVGGPLYAQGILDVLNKAVDSLIDVIFVQF